MELLKNRILLLEGPKFPSFDFNFSAKTNSNRFRIKDQIIFLYSSDAIQGSAESRDDEKEESHTVKTAGSVWDAVNIDTGLILAKYIEKQSIISNNDTLKIEGKKIIELGSGKSIPSIAAIILGARSVTITDSPSVIPSILRIMELNKLKSKHVHVRALDWEQRETYIEQLNNNDDNDDSTPYDYIFAADVVWVDYLIEPLVETID
ncbi:3559_t:CDS:2, partial [Ambispora leptoticha]